MPELTIRDELLCLPDAGDWATLARATGIEVGDLRKRYVDTLEQYIKSPKRVEVGEATVLENLTNTFDTGADFEINKAYTITVVPGVLAVRVDVGIQPLEDWYGKVTVTATVFGKNVGTSEAQISRLQSFFEIHPGALVVKADLKIGLYGEKLCFGIEGTACYWGFGWKCQDFNKQNLFCLK